MAKKEKKKITKKVIIFILVLFCFLLIIINTGRNTNTNINNLISEINNLNNIVNNIDLNDKTKYTLDNNLTCYMNTKDTKDYIQLLKDIYVFPFYENGNFNLVKNNDTDKIYVCIPNDCKVKKINEYAVVSEEDDLKIIRINEEDYILKLINGKWKFVFPILQCE